MKKFIIALLMVLFCATPIFAAQFDNYTKDVEIKSALTLLKDNGADEVFDNLDENSVKISFYDLSMLAGSFANHFAINTVDSFGNRYIFINVKFKNASPEELACLIAHESFHKLSVATLEEETLATQKEAFYWSKLKNNHKSYDNSDLLSRLNNLVGLRKASTIENDLILNKISNSSFYRQQLAIAK